MKIPATMTVPAGKILTAMVLMNRLPEGKHIIRDCNRTGGGNERLLRFGAEKELVDAIRARGGTVYVLASKLEVLSGGARLG